MACTLVAGAVVLIEATLTELPGPAWPQLWWTSYAVLIVVQSIATGLVPAPTAVPDAVWLPALVVCALGTFLLYPDHGLTAAIIVVSAAAVARHASKRAVVAVIALQSAAAIVAVTLTGWPLADILAGAVVYPGFQAFGAVVVLAARRETEARQQLAKTHAALRSTVPLLAAATRDAERIRIARDLHDMVGHQLTALALELEVASHLVGQDEAGDHVVRARAVTKRLLVDVRAAVAQMRLGPGELGPMLEELADDVPGLDVSIHVEPLLRVEGETAQTILRCAQEAVTNTLRHAGADKLEVLVHADGNDVVVRAVDDGCGTDGIVPGHGLTGMRERLEALGGSLALSSGAGTGFVIEARLPHAGQQDAP